jgi:NAD(P)-dependent dehydrogenase (short-subunit alcohol dehydrogenase family)
MQKRLSSIPKTKLLEGKRIVVTGCGFKPTRHKFFDVTTKEESHDSIIVDGKNMKLNIGAAIAFVLASNGAIVHLVSRTEDKLKILKEQIVKLLNIPEKNVEYSVVDLLEEKSIKKFVKSLPKDKPIFLVQSIGLGAGAYKLKDDNPYLHIEDIPPELIEKESTIVLKGTHILLQNLLPVFREQNKKFKTETRVAIISSMSAIRGYNLGGTHCAAKGAISRYTNSAMLDLWKERIFITDVRPGAVDTGMYDNPNAQKAVLEVDKEYGNYWNQTEIRLAPPISVGYAINMIFTVPAHITSLNLVAKGQFPNEGS